MHDASRGGHVLRREVHALLDGLLARLDANDRANLLAFLSLSAEHPRLATRLRINRRGEVFVAVRAIGGAI